MNYVSYTVGAYTDKGRQVSGGEHTTLTAANVAMEKLAARADIASVELYGWTEEGYCEPIDGDCK